MLVYRVEDALGRGAFHGLVRDACDAANMGMYGNESPYRHPGPDDEPKLRNLNIYGRYHFGFESMAALVRWFDSEAVRREMHRLGGEVVVYTVDHRRVRKGDMQLVFKKEHAKVVERRDIPVLACG